MITDTDSLTYEINTDDKYKEVYKSEDMFDFSKYLENSKF